MTAPSRLTPADLRAQTLGADATVATPFGPRLFRLTLRLEIKP